MRTRPFRSIVFSLVLLACLLVGPVLLISAGRNPFQDAPPTPELPGLLSGFLNLLGFAGFSAALINAGKTAGIVKDGQAPKYSLVINLIGFVLFVVIGLFKPDFDVANADSALGTGAQILTLVLGLVVQLGGAKVLNQGLRGLPVIGKSHSKPTNSPAQISA